MPSKKQAASHDANMVQEGELAVKLTSDISGGVGNHEKGTLIRRLSPSAFNTIVHGGLGEALKAGADASDAVDASAPVAPAPAPAPAETGGTTE